MPCVTYPRFLYINLGVMLIAARFLLLLVNSHIHLRRKLFLGILSIIMEENPYLCRDFNYDRYERVYTPSVVRQAH